MKIFTYEDLDRWLEQYDRCEWEYKHQQGFTFEGVVENHTLMVRTGEIILKIMLDEWRKNNEHYSRPIKEIEEEIDDGESKITKWGYKRVIK